MINNLNPEKNEKLFLIITALFSTIQFCAQTFQFAKSMGGTINDYGQSITSDAAGNVYTTGYFTGNADFDPSVGTFTYNCLDNGDVFVSKLDAAGNFVWAKKIAGTGASGDTGEGITLDASGNIYITGRFSGTADFDPGVGTYTLTSAGGYDIFVCKLDASGNFVWARKMSGSGVATDIGKSITVDGSGNVYTCGYFSGTGDFDPGAGTFTLASKGSEDVFVSKLDAAGNFAWAKSMGGTGFDDAFGIALDATGNVYTTGNTAGGDFDPGAATVNLTNGIFISKLDNSGNFVWAKQFTAGFNIYSYAITIDPTGNIYTTGSFSGSSGTDFDPGPGVFNLVPWSNDMFISKLDASGNFVWAKAIGASGDQTGTSIALDASGNVFTTGWTTGLTDFDPSIGTYTLTSVGMDDMFISKLDAAGNFVSAVSMGGPWPDRGADITVDAACNIYLTGNYNGTVDFNPGVGTYTLASLSSADIFVLKFSCLPTAINEANDLFNSNVFIYPNPTSGKFSLNFNEEVSCDKQLTIFDISGKEILKHTILSGEKQSDLEIKTTGMYFISLEYEGTRLTKKVVVQ